MSLTGSDNEVMTDRHGNAILRDVPTEECELVARYGQLVAGIAVKPLTLKNKDDEIVMTLTEPVHQGIDVDFALFCIKTGEAAPELQVSGWTDGIARNLKDLRGKVVVLWFWSRLDDDCKEELNVAANLQSQFHDKDVVFLGIHPPEEDMQLVRDYLKSQDIHLPTGIDIPDETAEHEFPQMTARVVIGRDGKVVSNSATTVDDDATLAIVQEAIKALGIPVDDKGEPVQSGEGCESCARIWEYYTAKMIDLALQQPAAE